MPPESSLSQFGQLVALDADVQPGEFVLREPVCLLGRAHECQVVITRKVVSRVHARIERAGSRYMLHDAGSANGTFVNTQKIAEPYFLKDRDLIGLGATTGLIRFVDPDPTFRETVSTPPRRLRYDEQALLFFVDEKSLDLPRSQFRLLLHLYRHEGAVCSRESCAEAIWGRQYDPGMDADALDRNISNLRGQLRQVAPNSDFIQLRRGLGYMLVV